MARKKKHEEHENLERWLVSYADFITLLFAFFTVMYATSQQDAAKYKQAAEAISRSFLSSGGIFPLKGSPMTPFEKPPDKGSRVPPAEEKGKFSKEEEAAMSRMKEKLEGLYTQASGLTPGTGDIEIFKFENGYKIRIGEELLYRPGSDRLKRENVGFLLGLGKQLARAGFPIQVEGHADSRELASGRSTWDLSLSRSHNVVRFLVEGAAFPKSKISIVGFGDTHPISDNSSPEGRAKNRRVEIAVLTGGEPITDQAW